MNKRNNKKGFTITELVIVIVVIAILAAVLIPTFASLIKKANVSADTQVAKNLNTALSMAEASGEKDMTFTDAQAAVRNAGYILSSLNPTAAGNYFVWESDSNQILLVDKDMKILYKAKDIKEEYATIDGGTWHIALNDPSLLDGIADIQIIPAMNESTIAGDGNKVTTLLNAGGTVTLSEPVTITTAPTHATYSDRKDGIRIKDGQEVTLDLNGQTMTTDFDTYDYRAFQLFNGKLKLVNGAVTVNATAGGTKEANGLSIYGIVNVGGNGSETQELLVKDMKLTYLSEVPGDKGKGGTAISINDKNATALIEDTTILVANAAGVYVGYGEATLKNVVIKSAGDAGYISCAVTACFGGTATIDGGYYTSETAVVSIYPTGGTINIKGGTFSTTADELLDIYAPASNAVADSTIVITGGIFNGTDYKSITEAQWKTMCGDTADKVTVTGAGTTTVTISIAQ